VRHGFPRYVFQGLAIDKQDDFIFLSCIFQQYSELLMGGRYAWVQSQHRLRKRQGDARRVLAPGGGG
jgi:hypothetical protein